MQSPAKPISAPPADSLVPIRTVSALTGVNAVTLRAWERRYGLIKPRRTAKGHRLYSQQDVARIQQIVELLGQGLSVSRVEPLLGQSPGEVVSASPTDRTDTWKRYRDAVLAAIEQFDELAIDRTYNDALSLYPIDIVNQHLTKPLLRLLGERWNKRATGIAEEHFFSLYLRNKLGARIHHMHQTQNGALLLLACLPGEMHETGLLFFALSAIDAGFRVLILGANTPLQQIPLVHKQKPCAGVVLAGSMELPRPLLTSNLPDLIKQIDVPVFVGGRSSVTQQNKIEQSGAVCLAESITASLQLISVTLNSRRSS